MDSRADAPVWELAGPRLEAGLEPRSAKLMMAIERHVARRTRHGRGCRCMRCAAWRVRLKRYARIIGLAEARGALEACGMVGRD